MHLSVFAALHPLFLKALPDTCRGSADDVNVKLISETLVSISFVLPKIDLENSRHRDISTAIVSLLEFLETLVKEAVREMRTPKHNDAISEEVRMVSELFFSS